MLIMNTSNKICVDILIWIAIIKTFIHETVTNICIYIIIIAVDCKTKLHNSFIFVCWSKFC